MFLKEYGTKKSIVIEEFHVVNHLHEMQKRMTIEQMLCRSSIRTDEKLVISNSCYDSFVLPSLSEHFFPINPSLATIPL